METDNRCMNIIMLTAYAAPVKVCRRHIILNLLSLEAGSLRGWLAGVGEDDDSLRSSAGETLVGLVEANSSTNCSMSARGYLVGPEP